MCCTLNIRQVHLTLQRKHKSKSTRLKFAKYHSNSALSCLRLMCQLFIDDILKTFKKETNQLLVLIIMTSTHSANLVAWYREYDVRLTVSGNDPIGRDESNLKNRTFSMRYRFIFLAITHTANTGLQGAMRGTILVMIITRFRHCLWNFMMKS